MPFTKLNFSLYTLIFYCLLGFGQSAVTCQIIDSENDIAIPYVIITNSQSKDTLLSDSNGLVILEKGKIFQFVKSGYITAKIKTSNEKHQIVQLQINPSQLSEVIINSNQIPIILKKHTNSISIISKKDINLGNNIDMSQVINRATGVFMQSGALNTNRITIRGIGSRNSFGTAKIRAYFKDIPLTNGSGETIIEDLELASISNFEILKGAGSTIYGAGLGGTILITPKSGSFNQTTALGELTIGSFGLIKGILSFNHTYAKQDIQGAYSNTHSDGYRENNKYDRQTLTINTNHFLNNKNRISVLLNYIDLKAFIPSSLNESDFINNPESAAFTWKSAQGFEDSQKGILGFSWHHNYTNKTKQISSIFTSFNNAYEPRPFNILDEETLSFGLRTQFLSEVQLFNKTLSFNVGIELFKDHYKHKTFENLYQDFPPGTGSVQGTLLSNFSERRGYYNIFLNSSYYITKNTTFSAGLNINETSYKLNDRFPVSPENPDQSGEFKFDVTLSPKLGLSHLLTPNISLYANVSHGFSPLSLQETLLPNGQINNNLKPETGWTYEFGTRGELFKNKLQYNATIFRLDVKNLLVPRRTDTDEFIGVNAGRTQHDGLELSLRYQLLSNNIFSINPFLSYTLNNFTFKEFKTDMNDYSGNDLTGVPSQVFNCGLILNSDRGFYGNINFQYVDEMPITDSNTLFSDDYKLTNLKLGYQKRLNKNLKLNIFLGINNIFDETYASQILINAGSFGGRAPRYYYPGNPINYYSGLNVNYSF